ncbi:MAG TPA: exosortase-associated EpsI family protein [Sedimentisphaerales bacterium]|nr:exosortase-associated EpsI family protein [Sedimentisphaerales bacterium]
MVGKNSTVWYSIRYWSVCILAFVLLIVSGAAYRVIASHLKVITSTPIGLPVALSGLPFGVSNWAGKDVPIPQNIQRSAGNDDFVNRLYVNKSNNEWANLYIAYTARPRTMLGHQPRACYVGGGWVHDSTYASEVNSNKGRRIPCLIHLFHIPAPHYEERIVLNFYIVNGRITADESVFTGVGWRTPNIAGDPARYVAQIQISSVLENSVREAAKDMVELVLDFFPDENGNVRATEFVHIASEVVE